ncbi:hypothetical protein CAEBREN_07362 [Caenorhabditis brenneri]|uniref:BTB domain-containing protein n=1 Tax=Caenorhabditis brenneri TaxID=135651 RepID=G0MV05_CAEBE|nr:hypothetical protein CAEBREN_07362 [Caenorhabditis brenneri]
MAQPGPSRKRRAPSVVWDYPERTNLMSFDNSDENMFDVELVVEDQSFYVLKGILAKHSTTFKSLFFGDYKEKGMKRIELGDIGAYEFQLFLECIYGCPCVDGDSVELIAKLAERWNAPMALAQCEKFLMNEPKEKMKKCFEIAVQYKMDKLKTKLITDIKTLEELALIMPTEILSCQPNPTFDAKLMFELLQKFMILQTARPNNLPPPTARIWTDDQSRQFLEQQYRHYTALLTSLNFVHQQQANIINQAGNNFYQSIYAAYQNPGGQYQYPNPFGAAAAAPRREPEVIEDDDEDEDPVQPPTPQPVLNEFQPNYQAPAVVHQIQLNFIAELLRAQGNNFLQQHQPYPQEYAQPIYLVPPPDQPQF